MRKYIFTAAEAQNPQLQRLWFTHPVFSNYLSMDTGGILSGACSNVHVLIQVADETGAA